MLKAPGIATGWSLAFVLLHGCAGEPVSDVEAPEPDEPFRTVSMQCGTLSITFRDQDGRVELETPERSFRLEPASSAADARYQAVADPDTAFRISGDRAQLTLKGETLPECLAPRQVAQPFVARGNEPFWRIDLDGDTLTLNRLGHDLAEGEFGWDDQAEDASRGSARLGDERLTLTVRHEICQDSMTGMPYPRAVTLVWQDQEYSGCGGDPDRLLRGGTWVVDQPVEQGLLPSPLPTLKFLADGRVAGQAACNRYTAGYELSGEGLSIGRPAVTRMACPAEVMEQEGRFLDRLAEVSRFRIAADGALELIAADDVRLRLRQQ